MPCKWKIISHKRLNVNSTMYKSYFLNQPYRIVRVSVDIAGKKRLHLCKATGRKRKGIKDLSGSIETSTRVSPQLHSEPAGWIGTSMRLQHTKQTVAELCCNTRLVVTPNQNPRHLSTASHSCSCRCLHAWLLFDREPREKDDITPRSPPPYGT